MTITYTHEVANARLGGFSSLLLRWKGSVYKLFYKEFIIYIVLYTTVSVVYRTVDNTNFKDYFEKLCLQFQSYTDLIPISFVLGFYVSMVVGRWWSQYENLPWPDRLMILVPSSIHGSDSRGRMIRRTLLRYVNLSQVLTYRAISTAAFKRFPTIRHIIDAGFMTKAEYKEYESVKTKNIKYWVPCVWFANLLAKIRQEGRIYDDMTYTTIMQEMNNFRSACGTLFSYDWISIPLVYTQVVTVAVYAFFMSTILSRQYLDTTKNYSGHEVDLYIPIFTIFQFFFYVGWLKVAEQLINPFGEDDDDFEVNWIIDRNLEVSMLAADNMYMKHPKLERDRYWNNPNPSIPYTAAAANHKVDAFIGSTMDMRFDPDNMEFLPSSTKTENLESYVTDYNQNIITSTKSNQPNTKDSEETQNNKEEILPKRSLPKMITNALTATINRHFMSQNHEENEAKTALIEKDFRMTRLDEVIGEANISSEQISIEKNDKKAKDDMLSPEPDSDDSELGSVSDSSSQRRSSLSSEEEDLGISRNRNEQFPDTLNARNKNLHQTTEESAMKAGQGSSLNQLGISKLRRPDKLTMNPTNQTKSMHRNVSNQKKKSPKKRTNINKYNKSKGNINSKNSCDTDQERRNAQIRTVTMLKNTRKKSLQALQRNARRTAINYRYHSSLGIHSPDCNTSMTSGTEDPTKQENDSPFGSLLSFATSIPSPRPLRWCYNQKRALRHNLESPLMTSNLPSPTANDDYGSALIVHDGLFGSPRLFVNNTELHQPCSNTTIEANTSVVQPMPYTEDLRKRLLVVNHNHTPPSPSKMQTIPTKHVQDMSIPKSFQCDHSDSVNPPKSAHVSSDLPAAENNSTEKPDNSKGHLTGAHENQLQPFQTHKDVAEEPIHRCSSLKKQFVTRSKSCSDVPISRRERLVTAVNEEEISAGTMQTADKPPISDPVNIQILASNIIPAESEVSDSKEPMNQNNNILVNPDDSSVHWENECDINKHKRSNPSKTGCGAPSEMEAKLSTESKERTSEKCNAQNDVEELPVPEVCFSTGPNTLVTSQTFASESAERYKSDSSLPEQSDVNVTGSICPNKPPFSKIISNSHDQGYHSAKEEADILLAASAKEPFKIRDSCYNTEIDRVNQMRKIAEIANVQFHSEKRTHDIEKLITTNEGKYCTQDESQSAAEANDISVSSNNKSSASVLVVKSSQSNNEHEFSSNVAAINALV